MNRLSNYFQSAKLARSFLHSAEECRQRGEHERALRFVIQANIDLITAMNNVASIAFNQKPKRRKNP